MLGSNRRARIAGTWPGWGSRPRWEFFGGAGGRPRDHRTAFGNKLRRQTKVARQSLNSLMTEFGHADDFCDSVHVPHAGDKLALHRSRRHRDADVRPLIDGVRARWQFKAMRAAYHRAFGQLHRVSYERGAFPAFPFRAQPRIEFGCPDCLVLIHGRHSSAASTSRAAMRLARAKRRSGACHLCGTPFRVHIYTALGVLPRALATGA